MTEKSYTVAVIYGWVDIQDYDRVIKIDENGKRWYGSRSKVTRYDNKPSDPPRIASVEITEPVCWICYD